MLNYKQKKNKLVVIALGGNHLLEKGAKGTIEEQEKSAGKISQSLLPLIKSGYNIVITHGNGPQVGAITIQNEAAKDKVPMMPLDVRVAMSQGSMGYILQQALLNALKQHHIRRYVVTMITQVLVDPEDNAFENPTKPIGPFYTKKEALEFQEKLNWVMIEDSGRGFRRVVPSPYPRKTIQRIMVKKLAIDGHIVIASGGGGIPIWKSDKYSYRGMEAVIDKDLASSLLAREISANMLIILTSVNAAYLNFNKKNQKRIDKITFQQAIKYMDDNQFGIGSMNPKIKGAVEFVKSTGNPALITSGDHIQQALEGKDGTLIYSDTFSKLNEILLFDE